MAGRSDIEAGKAHILIYMKSQLQAGLKAARDQLQGLGKNIIGVGAAFTGLGASITAPLGAAVNHFAAFGDTLDKMAARTGVSASALAELGFAAEQSGSNLEDVERAIRASQKRGRDFFEVAAEIAAIQDPAERAAAALKNWEEAGTKIIPMLGDLQALRQEARDLGIVPAERAVKDAAAITDAFNRIRRTMQAVAFEAGAALAPMLLPALDIVRRIGTAVIEWTRRNGELIRTVALVGAGLVAAGAAITAIGAAFFAAGTAAGLLSTAIGTATAIVGGLLSPIVLIPAAILGGVAAWVAFTDSGRAALQAVLDAVAPFVETIRDTLGGIGDALSSGDFLLAARIGFTGLQLIATQAVDAIAETIGGTFGDVLGDVGSRLIQGDFAAAWQTVVGQMAKLWADFAAGVVGVFTAAADAVLAAWQQTVNAISDSLLDAGGSGGALGAVVSRVLGVDLAAEQRRADALNSRLGLGPTDVTADAKAAAQSQTDAMAAPIRDWLAGMNQSFVDQAEATAQELERRLGPGSNAAVARLETELAELRRQAAAAKEAAVSATGKQLGPDTSGLEELKSKVTVGFSAAGLLAAGAGGPQERIARGVEKLAEQQRRTNELLEAQAAEDWEVVA